MSTFDNPPNRDLEFVDFINNYEGSIDSLPYALLFYMIGVDPQEAVTVIPFLKKDQEYLDIPGKVVRVNDLDGFYQEEKTQDNFQQYQQLLPEIELIPADLSAGFPADFPYKANLLILNHGIVLPELRGGGDYVSYLKSVDQVLADRNILIYLDDEDLEISEIEALTGKKVVDLSLSPDMKMALTKKSMMVGNANSVGQLIKLPESHRGKKVVFLR